MSRVFEEECPADPGSSPGEGDNKYTATTVPRSLGGQDSRFSLSPLCVAPTPCTTHHVFRKEASTPGFTHFDWVRLPACDAGKFHALL